VGRLQDTWKRFKNYVDEATGGNLLRAVVAVGTRGNYGYTNQQEGQPIETNDVKPQNQNIIIGVVLLVVIVIFLGLKKKK